MKKYALLDYLHKTNFGAGIKHLKVENGDEVNSTVDIKLTRKRLNVRI